MPENDDDEDRTTVDSKKPAAAKPAASDDDDDDATVARGPPKKVLAERAILEASRRMNAQAPEKPKKKVHPLVAVGVALAILAAALLLINALMSSPAEEGQSERKGIHKMFDW